MPDLRVCAQEYYTHVVPPGLLGICVKQGLLYTYRSSGTRISEVSAFYRHIAPLEREVEHINFNSKPMNLQYLATVK